jgi:hypothetical protein
MEFFELVPMFLLGVKASIITCFMFLRNKKDQYKFSNRRPAHYPTGFLPGEVLIGKPVKVFS